MSLLLLHFISSKCESSCFFINTIVHIYSLSTSWTFNKFFRNKTLFQRSLQHNQTNYVASLASEYRLLVP